MNVGANITTLFDEQNYGFEAEQKIRQSLNIKNKKFYSANLCAWK
jgi:hypothetical protein